MAKTVFDDTPPTGTIVTAAFLNALQAHRHDGANADGSCPIEYAVAGGSGNAFTLALTPALLAHTAGLLIRFKANHTINGAATVNIDGLGAIAIKKQVSTNLITGDIVNGQIVTIVYDGTYYQALGLPVIAPGSALQDLGTNSGATGVEWYNGVRKLLDAKGAMVYASAANALAKLAIGSANHKIYVNAAGDLPEYAKGMVVKTFTRAMTDSSADVGYTGLGFKPAALILIGGTSAGDQEPFSIGITDGTVSYCIYGSAYNTVGLSTSKCMIFYTSGSVGQTAALKSSDVDGFTLTWQKVAEAYAKTITFSVLAFR